MSDTRRRKQEISGCEFLPSSITHEGTRTRNDDVRLVPRVRCLWIAAHRSIDLDQQAPMAEQRTKALSLRTGKRGDRFCLADLSAGVELQSAHLRPQLSNDAWLRQSRRS